VIKDSLQTDRRPSGLIGKGASWKGAFLAVYVVNWWLVETLMLRVR